MFNIDFLIKFFIISKERKEKSKTFSPAHFLPSTFHCNLNISINKCNFNLCGFGRFNCSQKFCPWLLAFIQAHASLFRTEHGLHEYHWCFAFFDDSKQAFLVETASFNQCIMSGFTQFNSNKIRLIFSNLCLYCLYRCGCNVGCSKQSQRWTHIDERSRGCQDKSSSVKILRSCSVIMSRISIPFSSTSANSSKPSVSNRICPPASPLCPPA